MEIEKEIRKILWGKSIVSAKDCNGQSKTYVLRSLTMSEMNYLDFIYDQCFNESIESGLLSKEELDFFYKNNEIWTDEDEQELKDLKKEIAKQKGLKSKLKANKTKIKILSNKIKKLEDKLSNMIAYKQDLDSCSAEKHAEEISNRHMIHLSATDKFGKRLWEEDEDFLNCTDEKLIYNLTINYYKNNFLSDKQLRKIARSGVWRYRWSASKNGESLFGKPISEWTSVQNHLVYWSQYYDYIYENPDRPDDATIEDDDSIDRWMENESKKNKKSRVSKKSNKNSEFVEDFIVVEDGDSETIKDIYDENTISSRQVINKTREQVQKNGKVNDWQVKKNFRKGSN